MRIAIMQGRLLSPEEDRFQCFPRNDWRTEFASARAAGLDAIEWIYDLYGAEGNPLATDAGVAEMRSLSEDHGVQVVSLCADYFMDRPFVKAPPEEFAELEAHLEWLLTRCSLAGIERVVLPFVDASRMDTAARQARVTGMLRRVVARAKATGVEIHLETSLDPAAFAALLDEVPHSMLKANYDSGNSASLGYDVRQELAAYGNRIGSVHIKDRIRGGGTVPLGTGNADLPALFTELAATEYAGDFVLQVARELPGNEIAWARQNREWVMGQLEAAFPVAAGSWF